MVINVILPDLSDKEYWHQERNLDEFSFRCLSQERLKLEHLGEMLEEAYAAFLKEVNAPLLGLGYVADKYPRGWPFRGTQLQVLEWIESCDFERFLVFAINEWREDERLYPEGREFCDLLRAELVSRQGRAA